MKIVVMSLAIFSFLHSVEIEKADLETENKRLVEKVKKLEKIVKNQEKLLKSKENVIKNQTNKCDEGEVFPKLMMKQEYEEKKLDKK